MAQSMTLGELIFRVVFKKDTRELKQFEEGIQTATRRINKRLETVGHAVRGISLAIVGIGAAAFATGSGAERAFLKLRTQLGLTEEDVKAIRPALERLSKETARPLDSIAEGYFSLRSAGLDAGSALETLTASAKAATGGLGETRDIAHVAGGAVNAYGKDVISGQRATEILLATVKEGNLVATDLTRGFGQLLQVAPLLGVEMDSLGAIIAGATGPSVSSNVVMTQLRQVLFGLVRPTETAKKQFKELGINTEDLAKRASQDLIGALQWLRSEVGDDTESFSRLFESQEAVGLIFDITGKNAERYRRIQENIRTTTGNVDEAHRIWAQSGFAQVEKATNDLKLTLASLYQNALVPILKLFGSLPSAVQQATIAIAGASVASRVLGGPSLGKIIAAVFRLRPSLLLLSVQLKLLTVQTWLANSSLVSFGRTVWTSSIAALRGLVTNLRRASLGILRFALKAIVAGISGVIAFGVALWASMIPPLIAATAAVTAFTLALLANPVVLIVVAIIGAFVALGFVVYKFRRQIVGALKTALAWARDNWPLLVGILLGPFGIVGALVWKFRDQILGAFQDVWDWLKESPIFGPVIDGIQAIIDFVRELPGRVLGILKDIPGMVADAIKDIPGLGGAINVITGAAGKVAGFLGKAADYHQGGIVPGPTGRPMLATVHGGEMILPPTGMQVLRDMFEGFRLGAAGLPTPPLGYSTMYRQMINNRPTVNMGDININITTSPGADSGEIAENVRDAVEDVVDKAIGKKFRDIAHDFDGPIER